MLRVLILIHAGDRIVIGQRLPEDRKVFVFLIHFLLIGRGKSFPVEGVDDDRMVFLHALLQTVLLRQDILVVVLVDIVDVGGGHRNRVADHLVYVDDVPISYRLQYFVIKIV